MHWLDGWPGSKPINLHIDPQVWGLKPGGSHLIFSAPVSVCQPFPAAKKDCGENTGNEYLSIQGEVSALMEKSYTNYGTVYVPCVATKVPKLMTGNSGSQE